MLLWHARQQARPQIGGHGDPGETEPREIVLREGREEAGLTDLAPAGGCCTWPWFPCPPRATTEPNVRETLARASGR
ncbi:NUDIX domain-containing protein [Amycolatopsis acidicola]|uniref:NUDIX domain-containing protein n=1 Tax=Amycolatopsis acidicola TaxID=2596893 RepID=UPI001FB62268|nr:NUDIX domain-containing protein [Amycolatopsis acidicola]